MTSCFQTSPPVHQLRSHLSAHQTLIGLNAPCLTVLERGSDVEQLQVECFCSTATAAQCCTGNAVMSTLDSIGHTPTANDDSDGTGRQDASAGGGATASLRSSERHTCSPQIQVATSAIVSAKSIVHTACNASAPTMADVKTPTPSSAARRNSKTIDSLARSKRSTKLRVGFTTMRTPAVMAIAFVNSPASTHSLPSAMGNSHGPRMKKVPPTMKPIAKSNSETRT